MNAKRWFSCVLLLVSCGWMHAESVPDGVRDFDFEAGQWRVHHRVKSAASGWIEFDGTCRNRAALDGSVNIEEHTFARPSGTTYGMAIRAYDAKTKEWAIWWVDSRVPHGALDPPMKGHFERGLGTFYSDTVDHGKTTRTRFLWSHADSNHAHWEQALSEDMGKTWATNWVMDFERIRDNERNGADKS